MSEDYDEEFAEWYAPELTITVPNQAVNIQGHVVCDRGLGKASFTSTGKYL